MLGAARKSAGGGVLKDLNLCGMWPPAAPEWMRLDAWQGGGHTAHIKRSTTLTNWISIDTAKVTLPAGVYSIRCDGLGSGIACEFRDAGANRLLGYISDAWKTLTVTEPMTVTPRLVISPNWTGVAAVSPVILEGDWGAGSELTLPDNLWPQEDYADANNGITVTQRAGLVTCVVEQDQGTSWNNFRFRKLTLEEGWYGWLLPDSATTPTTANHPAADCTDNIKYSVSANATSPRLLSAGAYSLQVTCHGSTPGTYTMRPYLYRIPC